MLDRLRTSRGAVAVEEAILGALLIAGLAGSFAAIGGNLRALIAAIYTEESSHQIGHGHQSSPSAFTPVPFTDSGPDESGMPPSP